VKELFEFPPTRSNRAKWALEELGVDYTSHVVSLPNGENNAANYKAIHPLGVVPAYRTATFTMFESVAIVLQLLDEHPAAGLAPAIGSPERAAYYQWSVFSCCELDPALFDVMSTRCICRPNSACPRLRNAGGTGSRRGVRFSQTPLKAGTTSWARHFPAPTLRWDIPVTGRRIPD